MLSYCSFHRQPDIVKKPRTTVIFYCRKCCCSLQANQILRKEHPECSSTVVVILLLVVLLLVFILPCHIFYFHANQAKPSYKKDKGQTRTDEELFHGNLQKYHPLQRHVGATAFYARIAFSATELTIMSRNCLLTTTAHLYSALAVTNQLLTEKAFKTDLLRPPGMTTALVLLTLAYHVDHAAPPSIVLDVLETVNFHPVIIAAVCRSNKSISPGPPFMADRPAGDRSPHSALSENNAYSPDIMRFAARSRANFPATGPPASAYTTFS